MQSVPLSSGGSGSSSTGDRGGMRRLGTNGDPVIQGEINWSVSQLRTLFNQGQHSPNGGSSSSTNSSSGGGVSSRQQQQLRFVGDFMDGKNSRSVSRQQQPFNPVAAPSPLLPQHQQQSAELDSDQESYV